MCLSFTIALSFAAAQHRPNRSINRTVDPNGAPHYTGAMLLPSVPKWRLPRSLSDEGATWLTWLVRLRWIAILGQVVALASVAPLLASTAALGVLACVMALLVTVNLHAARVVRNDIAVSDATLLAQLMTDIAALATFFALAGGATNPFIVLYLIHVSMASVILSPRRAALVTATILVLYAALHRFHLPLDLDHTTIGATSYAVIGSVVATTITTVTVAAFVMGLTRTLRWREHILARSKERTAATDRLRSVGTMAAGAAHELNTPLSTMGLRLGRIGRRHTDDATTADVDAIRGQLDRCERTVRQLLVSAGDPAASRPEPVILADMVREGIHLWAHGDHTPVTFTDHAHELAVTLPRTAFIQGLVNLLQNAREAQEEVGAASPIAVDVRHDGDRCSVVVTDHGVGLPSEEDRLGEPFFTTKPTGTGLGIFVARAVADGAGGGLRYVGGRGQTEAHWWFPTTSEGTPTTLRTDP